VALAWSLADLLRVVGVTPAWVLGRGAGEYAAAILAGALPLEAGLRLGAARGRLAQALAGDGARSPRVEPALQGFRAVASGVAGAAPRLGLVSSVTGKPVGAGEMDAGYWVRQTRDAVPLQAGISSLRAQGVGIFLEVGPQAAPAAPGPAGPEGGGTWLPTLGPGRGDRDALLSSLAALYVQGVRLDWAAVTGDAPRRTVALPTYPFERERYWMDGLRPGRRQASATPGDPFAAGPRMEPEPARPPVPAAPRRAAPPAARPRAAEELEGRTEDEMAALLLARLDTIDLETSR
jgi:acyl transferase domain-containing protein